MAGSAIDSGALLTVIIALGLAAAGVIGITFLTSLLDKRLWQRKTGAKSLWGREFNIVRQGLAEDQVVSFVTELMARDDTSIQAPPLEKAEATATISQEPKAQEVVEVVATVTPPEAEEVAAKSIDKSIEQSVARKAEPAMTEEEMQALFAGEVEIALDPAIDLALTGELIGHLLGNPDIGIVRVAGNSRQGNTIAVSLNKALPLIALLIDSFPRREEPLRIKGRGLRRIEVSLIKGGNSHGQGSPDE